jgi:O-antigen/teichoic acid export membrane protein
MLDQVLTVFGIVPDTMMKLNGLIVVPVALGLSIFSPWVVSMYGADYGHSWLTLVAAVWTVAIMGIITPIGDVIAASGHMGLGLIANSAWAMVFVVSTLFLVHWGSLGLASSRLIAYVAHAVWTVILAQMIIRSHRGQPAEIPAAQIVAEPEKLPLN